jgi:hypothetical protein
MIGMKSGEPEILLEDPGMSEVFRGIVEKCLWHEPHSFQEIMEKIKRDIPEQKSKVHYERQAYVSLLAAFDRGYIAKIRELFRLTVTGRNKFAEADTLHALAA